VPSVCACVCTQITGDGGDGSLLRSGHRGDRRTEKQYLVKWKGYTTAEASWEPARAVDAPDILRRYKDRQHDQDDDGQESTNPYEQLRRDEAKYDSEDDEQDSVD
jgi:hypothetical protein